jgi:hypothetical protein
MATSHYSKGSICCRHPYPTCADFCDFICPRLTPAAHPLAEGLMRRNKGVGYYKPCFLTMVSTPTTAETIVSTSCAFTRGLVGRLIKCLAASSACGQEPIA